VDGWYDIKTMTFFNQSAIIFTLEAFNWKQRRQLLLDVPRKKYPSETKPFGDFSEIEDLIDPARGDLTIDITDMENFEEPDRSAFIDYYENYYKVVDVPSLYGSNKPYGLLKKKCRVNPKYVFALPRWNKNKRRPI